MDQIEMFDVPNYHFYEFNRNGKITKAFIFPYSKESAWSGAWFKNEKDAIRYSSEFLSWSKEVDGLDKNSIE